MALSHLHRATLEKAADALRALGHPDRLRIVQSLAAREACVCELVDELGLRQPAISQHLSVLKRAGLVRSRRDGSFVRYRLAGQLPARLLAAVGISVPEGLLDASGRCGQACPSGRASRAQEAVLAEAMDS